MASLVRYAKPIKEVFGNEIRIILMSHGNHSGDFLHLISKPIKKVSFFKKVLNKIRLGFLLATESEFRVKYVDTVVALSETETQIENWFGAKQTLFLPRKLHSDFLKSNPIIGRVGFVGRLDHPPNLQGIEILLDEFNLEQNKSIEIRIVGAPEKIGKQLAKKYSQITYLGELSNDNLETEVATWSIFLNPVWWYSTGASTKLAKAISWGVPIVTTTAGMRGYKWQTGNLLVADTPKQMCSIINKNVFDIQIINSNAIQTQMVANSGFNDYELVEMIKGLLY
ncbi:MAG: glycosyltransferase family 4 protein [Chitinophagaceae bacterium]|nr:glycosyltransferase family 4 protein [Chitinophagaceae bacterium]